MADTTLGRVAAGTRARARPRLRRLTRQQLRYLLLALGPILVLVGAAWWYLSTGRWITTDDAYVRAEKVNISTDVAGMVAGIAVHDNQKVAAGQILYRLDDTPFRLALQNAEAQLQMVRDDILAAQASYRQTEASIRTAQADIVFYQRQFDRVAALLPKGFAPQQAADQAQHNLDTAKGRLAELQQQATGIAAKLNGNPDLPFTKQPQYLAALAKVEDARRNLQHTIVRAPVAGIVTNVPSLTQGAYLPAGGTGFNLVATQNVWVEADAKETELTHAAAGQPVTVTVDTYPGVEWHGTVESLAPASGGSFALLPAQNTSGNWVKVVQRIPMRIRVETEPGQPPLRDGMSAEVAIDTGHNRHMPQFLSRLFGLG
jgi:membrane fusion protein (multidrug efflux system)